MSSIEFENENDYTATIKVVGVGGGGTNAVNSMVRDNLRGVEFIIANTDLQSFGMRSRKYLAIRVGPMVFI